MGNTSRMISLVTIVAALAIGAMLGTRSGSATPSRATAGTSTDTLRDQAAKRLAQIDGTIDVPGLDSVVEVRRDRWGVPHIYARTQHDLFFAQGFVAAQDRLWQMDIWRRTAEGRLAEVLGAPAVERDRLARLFRYRGPADADWAAYGPDTKAIVSAFVGGVNAYIAQVKDRPPIEFTLMGYAPEPWTIDVPLARVTTLSGVSNATTEILRARLIAVVGKKATEAILPTEPTRALDPVPGLDLTGLDLKIPQGAADKRVRTARVDLNHRAVLFAVGDEHEPMWLLAAIKTHDEAYTYAETLTLEVNPANGAMEVLRTAAIDEKLNDHGYIVPGLGDAGDRMFGTK